MIHQKIQLEDFLVRNNPQAPGPNPYEKQKLINKIRTEETQSFWAFLRQRIVLVPLASFALLLLIFTSTDVSFHQLRNSSVSMEVGQFLYNSLDSFSEEDVEAGDLLEPF